MHRNSIMSIKKLDWKREQSTAITDSVTFEGVTANTVDLNGGTIDNTVIGGTIPKSGTFTSIVGADLTFAGGSGVIFTAGPITGGQISDGTASMAGGNLTANTITANSNIIVGASPNYVEIDSTSGIKYNGTATTWDDLRVPLERTIVGPGASSSPSYTVISANKPFAYEFISGSTRVVSFTARFAAVACSALIRAYRPPLMTNTRAPIDVAMRAMRASMTCSCPSAWDAIRLSAGTGSLRRQVVPEEVLELLAGLRRVESQRGLPDRTHAPLGFV